MAVKDGLPATDFSRQNREWVKAVAGGGSGGGGLPEITEADEGKVLTVESGEAAWATPGGGGGVLSVNLVFDEINEKTVFDKTYAEIKAAFESGKYVFCTDTDSGWRYIHPISIIGYDDSDPHQPPYLVTVDYIDPISYYCWNADEYPTDPAPDVPT